MSNKWTSGPWEAEHRPHPIPEQCGAVVTDQAGNQLFDSFNRSYKVSLIEQDGDDEDHRWYDTAGFNDLRFASFAPELYSLLEKAQGHMFELAGNNPYLTPEQVNYHNRLTKEVGLLLAKIQESR